MDPFAPRDGFTKPIGAFVVVLFGALFIGGWLYVDMVRSELEMKIEAVRSEAATADVKAVMGDGIAEEEKTWKTYREGNYRFQYPGEWRADLKGDDAQTSFRAAFFDQDDVKQAEYFCITSLETGFEGHTFTEETRTFRRGALSYRATLQLGTPNRDFAPDLGNLYMVSIEPVDDQNSSVCLLMSSTPNEERADLYRQIQMSVEFND